MAEANNTTSNYSIFFLLFSFALIIPSINAHIAEFDEYWQQREDQAKIIALNAYNPNPENITTQLNLHVENIITGSRRSLRKLSKKKGGPCRATNPIDRCWRCDPNWANNRKKLATCVLGFGHKTRGGMHGRFYTVTDPSDCDMVNPKPGTLRHAVTRKEPLWIIFAKSMIIRLNQELIMTCDKTIDARGANVRIVGGAGITLQFINNVIIHNLHIHDIVEGNGGSIRDSEDHVGFRTKSDGDGISIFGSTNIWIDHVSMSKCYDGLIDAIMGSTAITISNSHFTNHNEVMLFGASDGHDHDKIMQITVAFTHFGRGLVQRMPRCRFGFVHVLNNDYTHWEMYAIGGSSNPTIISQGNRFIAPNNTFAKAVTKREYAMENEWKNWQWRSEGDLMMNGAFFVQAGDPRTKRLFTRQQFIKAKPGTFVTRLTRYSGTLACKVGFPC